MKKVLFALAWLAFCQPAFALDSNYQTCFGSVDRWEGGYAQRAVEPGGCGSHGVSRTALSTWNKQHGLPEATCEDVKKITSDLASQIYAENFWKPIGGPTLPAGYDCAMLTAAVMFGPGIGTDERPGAMGLDAKAHGDLGELIILMMRAKMYRDDCGPISLKSGGTQWFCRGWSDRFLSVYELGRSMQTSPPPQATKRPFYGIP